MYTCTLLCISWNGIAPIRCIFTISVSTVNIDPWCKSVIKLRVNLQPMAEWLRGLALKPLFPLLCGSSLNPMRGSYQLLKECCCFTPRNNLLFQLWKLTTIYNHIWLLSDGYSVRTLPVSYCCCFCWCNLGVYCFISEWGWRGWRLYKAVCGSMCIYAW